jgi:tetratricopeptide (TPR) repeat protein
MSAERGDGDELLLPETVQGIIAARLDGLEPEEKALLQDAAVIGKVFWAGALAQMVGRDRAAIEETLHVLGRKEFVRRQRRPSVEGETEYSFEHLLVRDVAYGQIPRAARSEKHRAVAEWLSALGRAEEHSEVLAHHYLQAIEYARAAAEVDPALEERARYALRKAGDRALGLNAFAAAARFYHAALDLWPQEDPERGYVLYGLGVARNKVEDAVAELEEARDELLRRGDLEKAAEAEAMASYRQQQTDLSLSGLKHALELVQDRPPSRSKASVLAQLAYRAASVRDSLWEQYADEALEIAERLGLDDLRASVLITIGTGAGLGPDKAAGIAALEQAVKVADAIDSPESVMARINLAAVHQTQGDLKRCFDIQARARSDAARFGIGGWVRHMRAEFVWECYWRGRWDEGIREADALLGEAATGMRDAVTEIASHYLRAHMRLGRDDVAGAVADGEEAVRTAREWRTWGNLETAQAGLARVLLGAGRHEEADALVTELLRLEPDWYALPDFAICLDALDRADERLANEAFDQTSIWLSAAKVFVAGDYVAAADLYAKIGSLPDEADARLRSGIEGEVQRALEFYRSVGATRYIREGEALLTASA